MSDSLYIMGIFNVIEPDQFAERLINCKPEQVEYERALANVSIPQYFTGLSKKAFLQLLCSLIRGRYRIVALGG